jgi:hypothetical protein
MSHDKCRKYQRSAPDGQEAKKTIKYAPLRTANLSGAMIDQPMHCAEWVRLGGAS